MSITALPPVTIALGAQAAQQAARRYPALPFAITGPGAPADVFGGLLTGEVQHGCGATLQQAVATPNLPGVAIKPAPGQQATAEDEASRIDNVAREMESVLLYTLLKEMWATLPKSSLLDNGLGAKFYREMWLEEVSQRAADAGTGLGIAKVIQRELLDRAAREVTPAEATLR